MQVVLRTENKFLLDVSEYHKLANKIGKVLKSDIHNNEGGYLVRSLYFDTFDDKDFFEKEDGVYNRRKIRLRIYDPGGDVAYLEMKHKVGNNQEKKTLKMTKDDALELIKRNYSVLLKYDEPFAQEVFSYMQIYGYIPKCVVDYKRKAFILDENSTRITFDYDIKSSESSFDIFNDKLLLTPVFDTSNVILEVKYNGILLSYVKELINSCSKSKISVSKYCLGRTVCSHKHII